MLSALLVRGADMTRAPNLDANDKLVKRGLLVSWGGYRGTVQRVRTGRCLVRFSSHGSYVYPPTASGPLVVDGKWLPCASVQVVQP